MSASTAQVAIFGDLDADLWGLVIGGERPRVAVAGLTDADVALEPADLDLADPDVWTLAAAGCALRIERADATTSSDDGDGSLEPCRVSGSATVAGAEREFDIGGVRSAAPVAGDLDSLRLFGTWFPAGHEIALVSARPRGGKGHDRDSVGVVARGEEHPLVIDPRLSTTYDAHGAPRRVGLELWLGDDEDGDQWPRRVAGAATGSHVNGALGGHALGALGGHALSGSSRRGAAGDAAGVALDAYAFQCVSRAEPGAGVYLLLRSA